MLSHCIRCVHCNDQRNKRKNGDFSVWAGFWGMCYVPMQHNGHGGMERLMLAITTLLHAFQSETPRPGCTLSRIKRSKRCFFFCCRIMKYTYWYKCIEGPRIFSKKEQMLKVKVRIRVWRNSSSAWRRKGETSFDTLSPREGKIHRGFSETHAPPSGRNTWWTLFVTGFSQQLVR